MKESILYLRFLKKNLTLIIIPTALFLILGFVYQVNKPTYYQISRLYEFSHKNDNVQQIIPVVDQAIIQLRSKQVRQDLQIENLSIYKPGPLSMVVTINSLKAKGLDSELKKVDQFLNQKYNLKIVGSDITKTQKPDLIFIPTLISVVGFLLGLTFSLIKSYLKNY